MVLFMLLLLTRMKEMTTLRGLGKRSAAVPLALIAVVSLAIPALADSLDEIREKQERAAAKAARFDARGDSLAERVAALDAMRAEAEARVVAVKERLRTID